MSVGWYSCDYCEEIFCDYGECICECGKKWCCNECAEEDGFKEAHCKLGYDIRYEYSDDERCEKETCYKCENFIEESCSYCREEKFTEEEMLEKALELLGITEEELTKEMRESDE
ncbi:hypothetical protein [Clostridium massiliamazoniense]|uniref:hypothetical protein n=1 Tax=Clostridium massiliamazoniense TaxID=1347366 RepID=UPI0006D82724|nr:hypothetical protein [Clostridium massiliamazoniense]